MLRIVFVTTLMMLLATVAVRGQDPGKLQATGEPAVEKEAAEYRALLSQPPGTLAELCRERGANLLADLKHGRAIAKGEVREKNLERSRGSLLEKAADKKKQYEELRDRVRAEMETIRQQFADDSAECDRRLFALVNMNRAAAVALRDEAKQLEQLAAKKDERLAQVRTELVTLKQDWDLIAQGEQFRRTDTPPDLVTDIDGWGIGDETRKELGLDATTLGLVGLSANGLQTTAAKPTTSDEVQQAVDEFNSLFR